MLNSPPKLTPYHPRGNVVATPRSCCGAIQACIGNVFAKGFHPQIEALDQAIRLATLQQARMPAQLLTDPRGACSVR